MAADENVIGSAFGDLITGNGSANLLIGEIPLDIHRHSVGRRVAPRAVLLQRLHHEEHKREEEEHKRWRRRSTKGGRNRLWLLRLSRLSENLVFSSLNNTARCDKCVRVPARHRMKKTP